MSNSFFVDYRIPAIDQAHQAHHASHLARKTAKNLNLLLIAPNQNIQHAELAIPGINFRRQQSSVSEAAHQSASA